MKRPFISAHWTDEPELAAIGELCRLLDLGLQALIYCESGDECDGILRDILQQPRESDDPCFAAWQRGDRAAVVCGDRVPRPRESPCHILLPSIAGNYAGHAAFLRHAAALPGTVRLHLFLHPQRDLERQVSALLGDTPIPTAPDVNADEFLELEARLGWSLQRYAEHRPPALNFGITTADMAAAVAALEILSPTAFDISAMRMRNKRLT